MTKPTLLIGNKRHSSWSLRAWLPLRHWSVEFEERRLLLETDGFRATLAELNLNRRVPVLLDGGLAVWDSLAICEYANERWFGGAGWPVDRAARAEARAACAEMHSGFGALREALPMDCAASGTPVLVGEAVRRDVARVRELLATCRARHGAGGPWLFGAFSIADCYFAPIVVRFKGYGVPVEGPVAEWMSAMWAHPPLVEWVAAGRCETERVPVDELRVP